MRGAVVLFHLQAVAFPKELWVEEGIRDKNAVNLQQVLIVIYT